MSNVIKGGEDLVRVISALLKQRNSAPEDSPEHRMATRQLQGLRYSYEEAGGIIEDLDYWGWGTYCHPP
jgi:hypothetical protein